MLYVCLFWKAHGMKEVAIVVVSERFFLSVYSLELLNINHRTIFLGGEMEPLLQFLTFFTRGHYESKICMQRGEMGL